MENDLYLEAFYFQSATLEHCLQYAIEYQEEWIEGLVTRSDLKFQGTKSLKDKTLGQLIATFDRYCLDEDLVSRLSNFNSLRKGFVHGLLDSAVPELNELARKKYPNNCQLVRDMCLFNSKLAIKLAQRAERKARNLSARDAIKTKSKK